MNHLSIRVLLPLVLVGCFSGARPVSAACIDIRAFFTVIPQNVTYIYTPGHPFDGPYGPTGGPYGFTMTYYVRGYFWAHGGGDPLYGFGSDHGNRNGYGFSDNWLYPGFDGGFRGFIGGPYGHWQIPGTDGCITAEGSDQNNVDPDECMIVLISDQDFRGDGFHAVIAQSVATEPPFAGDFHLYRASNGEPIYLAPLPQPNVEDSLFSGSGEVEATLSVPMLNGPEDGLYLNCSPEQNQGVVLGYKIVANNNGRPGRQPPGSRLQCLPNTNDCRQIGGAVDWVDVPLTDLAGEPIDYAPLGSASRVTLFCDGPSEIYLATALVLEGGFRTPYVSRNSIAVACGTCSGTDLDRDGFCTRAEGAFPADCDDGDPDVRPGAPEICDGKNNDCNSPIWPELPPEESDADNDRFALCAGDCDDEDPALNPGAPEVCNAADDNCNGLADETLAGVASDGDGLDNACDNCPFIDNPDQADADGDEIGDACDACADFDHDGFGAPGDVTCAGGLAADCDDQDLFTYPGAAEIYDGRDNDCDAAVDEGLDADADGIPDFRDACADTPAASGVDPSGCAVCDSGGSSSGGDCDPPGGGADEDEDSDETGYEVDFGVGIGSAAGPTQGDAGLRRGL